MIERDDNHLLDTTWTMHMQDGYWYPIQPSAKCKPEDHGEINPHVVQIRDEDGNVIWRRDQ